MAGFLSFLPQIAAGATIVALAVGGSYTVGVEVTNSMVALLEERLQLRDEQLIALEGVRDDLSTAKAAHAEALESVRLTADETEKALQQALSQETQNSQIPARFSRRTGRN